MASRDHAGSVRPRSRRSIAFLPKSSTALDKENATTDVDAIKDASAASRAITRDKKSRSKSLGPGGLDALQVSNGNRRKVLPNCLSLIDVTLGYLLIYAYSLQWPFLLSNRSLSRPYHFHHPARSQRSIKRANEIRVVARHQGNCERHRDRLRLRKACLLIFRHPPKLPSQERNN